MGLYETIMVWETGTQYEMSRVSIMVCSRVEERGYKQEMLNDIWESLALGILGNLQGNYFGGGSPREGSILVQLPLGAKAALSDTCMFSACSVKQVIWMEGWSITIRSELEFEWTLLIQEGNYRILYHHKKEKAQHWTAVNFHYWQQQKQHERKSIRLNQAL